MTGNSLKMKYICILFLSCLIFAGCNSGSDHSGQSQNAHSSTEDRSATNPQTVTIDSADGLKLVGSFYPAAKPNSPGVLLLHQWQSDRHSFDDFAKQMNAAGFAALSIDGRGFGESTKKADGSTVTAERTNDAVNAMLMDVAAAFDFLSKQQNVDPHRVGICGASYGSSLAIIYSAENPRVAAIALLSPGLDYFGNMQTEPAVKKYGRRPLFLVAAEDDPDSAEAVKTLGSLNVNYQQKIYPSGGHGTALFSLSEKPTLSESLRDFFANAMRVE